MIRYPLILLIVFRLIQCDFTNRIINGKIVQKTDHYQFVVNFKLGPQHVCGGALISLRLVLSAAHCFTSIDDDEFKQLVAFAGKVDTNDDKKPRHIRKIYIHPDYNNTSNSHDIAVASVTTSFISDFSKVQIIEIAPKGFAWPVGDRGIIFGWGRTEEDTYPRYLKTANITMISKEVCRKAVATETRPVDDTMECAGDMAGGRDSCTADSGGPLVHFKTGYLIGIISWGIECGLKNMPGVYTSVSYFHDWIQDQVIIDRNFVDDMNKPSHNHHDIHQHIG